MRDRKPGVVRAWAAFGSDGSCLGQICWYRDELDIKWRGVDGVKVLRVEIRLLTKKQKASSRLYKCSCGASVDGSRKCMVCKKRDKK